MIGQMICIHAKGEVIVGAMKENSVLIAMIGLDKILLLYALIGQKKKVNVLTNKNVGARIKTHVYLVMIQFLRVRMKRNVLIQINLVSVTNSKSVSRAIF